MKSTSSKNDKFNDKKFRVKEKALKITVKKNENFEIEDLVKKTSFNNDNSKIFEEKNGIINDKSIDNNENEPNISKNGNKNIIINNE